MNAYGGWFYSRGSVECLYMFGKYIDCDVNPVLSLLPTMKPVQGLYKIGRSLLTTGNPVESLWSCCKPVLITEKPVDALQRFGKPV